MRIFHKNIFIIRWNNCKKYLYAYSIKDLKWKKNSWHGVISHLAVNHVTLCLHLDVANTTKTKPYLIRRCQLHAMTMLKPKISTKLYLIFMGLKTNIPNAATNLAGNFWPWDSSQLSPLRLAFGTTPWEQVQ